MKPRVRKLSEAELAKIAKSHCVNDPLGKPGEMFYVTTRDVKLLFGHIAALRAEAAGDDA